MFTLITQGSFVSAGVGVRVPLPSSADYFVTNNLTQQATTQSTGRGVKFEWWGNGLTAPGAATETYKANSSTDVLNQTVITSGGFTYVTQNPYVGPQSANAITNISQANPAVVTQTNTYTNGQYLRFYNTTGMPMLGGIIAQISSVSGSGYTLLGVPATAGNGFGAVATAGFTRVVSINDPVVPEMLYITNISQATSAVISTSVDPSKYYVVGMKIHFSVPKSFGMSEMDQQTGIITAVNAVSATSNIGAYNLTVNINSSAFTAFSFPASALSPTAQLFATLAPAGASTQFNPITNVQTGYNFQYQPFQSGNFIPYMWLPAGAQSPAGSSEDVIVWQAYKMEGTFYPSYQYVPVFNG